MPTFIDESGDTGRVLGASSDWFRLAAVWVPNHETADAIRAAIANVRVSLRLRTGYEFKYSKTHSEPDRRTAFFAAALRFAFCFAFVSLDKRDPTLSGAGSEFIHWATATTLAATLRPVYLAAGEQRLNERIVVDDNRDGHFLGAIKTAFRGLGSACVPPRKLVKDARFADSATDDLLQLTDMVCGAVGDAEDGERRWYEVISERDLDRRRV